MRVVVTSSLVVFGLAILVTCQLAADDNKAKETKAADALLIKAQKICPVSGDEFNHGEAVRTKIGDVVMFLCCEDCKGKDVNKAHMAKITANMIDAQKKCPVMGKALPKDAPSIVVDGRQLFVCCKPCTKKIAADPKKYIAKTDELLTANLKEKKNEPAKK